MSVQGIAGRDTVIVRPIEVRDAADDAEFAGQTVGIRAQCCRGGGVVGAGCRSGRVSRWRWSRVWSAAVVGWIEASIERRLQSDVVCADWRAGGEGRGARASGLGDNLCEAVEEVESQERGVGGGAGDLAKQSCGGAPVLSAGWV